MTNDRSRAPAFIAFGLSALFLVGAGLILLAPEAAAGLLVQREIDDIGSVHIPYTIYLYAAAFIFTGLSSIMTLYKKNADTAFIFSIMATAPVILGTPLNTINSIAVSRNGEASLAVYSVLQTECSMMYTACFAGIILAVYSASAAKHKAGQRTGKHHGLITISAVLSGLYVFAAVMVTVLQSYTMKAYAARGDDVSRISFVVPVNMVIMALTAVLAQYFLRSGKTKMLLVIASLCFPTAEIGEIIQTGCMRDDTMQIVHCSYLSSQNNMISFLCIFGLIFAVMAAADITETAENEEGYYVNEE